VLYSRGGLPGLLLPGLVDRPDEGRSVKSLVRLDTLGQIACGPA